MSKKSQCLPILLLLLEMTSVSADSYAPELRSAISLFRYREIEKSDLLIFPQWLSVMQRHLTNLAESGTCPSVEADNCLPGQWQIFLNSIKNLSASEQIERVNRYANQKKYVTDSENYGSSDYWATPQEFLKNSGDCEDYAIMKLLSLKWLGHNVDTMRIVVVQDTRRRTPHAVMAIQNGDDILILDNQIEDVVSHVEIAHYVPVYSVNETSWWMHMSN